MVESTFTKYDTDSDGKLSAEEIQAVDSRFRDRLTGFDADGDGSLDKQEVIKGMQSATGGPR